MFILVIELQRKFKLYECVRCMMDDGGQGRSSEATGPR